MNMKFIVTQCLGGGDGGDVEVEVEVTEEDIEAMKDLVREQDGDGDYFPDYCEALYEKIKSEAAFSEDGEEYDEEADDTYYRVTVPQEIFDAVEEEDE